MILRENMQIKREIAPKVALSSEIKKESNIIESAKEDSNVIESAKEDSFDSKKTIESDTFLGLDKKYKNAIIASSIVLLGIGTFFIYKRLKK